MQTLYKILAGCFLFLIATSYTSIEKSRSQPVAVDGFGWSMTTFDYAAFQDFWQSASAGEKARVGNELFSYYLNEVVPQEEKAMHKQMIFQNVMARKWYNLPSFEEASATDQLVRFLFTPESPLHFEKEDQGFSIPTACMDDLIYQAYASKGKLLPQIKKGRRFNSRWTIECDPEMYNMMTNFLRSGATTLPEELKTKYLKKSRENEVKKMYPCYYTYIIFTPDELSQLQAEMEKIKKFPGFSPLDYCYIEDFYKVVKNAALKKEGLFLYTTD